MSSDLERILCYKCLEKPTSSLYAHFLGYHLLTFWCSTSGGPLMPLNWTLRTGRTCGIIHKKFWSLFEILIQFKLVHRAFLYMILYTFWSCPANAVYWTQVLCYSISNQYSDFPSPTVCLLGLVEDLASRVMDITLIRLLFFYARKAITVCWKKWTPPSLPFWKRLVNKALPYYKDTYAHKGCPRK